MANDEDLREPPGGIYRFIDAELDPRNHRLTVAGSIRPLEPKAFRLLLFLIENRGRAVSKDEILASIWADTFVTDNALTRPIAQIRKALNDDVKEPRYIETVPTVGYRFIAEIHEEAAVSLSGPEPEPKPERETSKGRRVTLLAALAALAVVLTAGIWWARNQKNLPTTVLLVHQSKLTYFPGEETDPAVSPDGRSLVFAWNGAGATRDIYVMPLGSQTPVRLTQDTVNDLSPAWSPDGKQIAFLRLESIAGGSLMVVPATGGPERVIREFHIKEDVYRAMRPLLTWAPDGRGIVYTTQDDGSERASLYVTDLEGKTPRKLFTPDEVSYGATAPAFSRDGEWLAYTTVTGQYGARLNVRHVEPGLTFREEILKVPSPPEKTATLITSPVWTPDGKRLLFMQNSAIFEWVRGGADPHQIYVGARFAGMSVVWGQGQAFSVVAAEGDRGAADQAELQMIPLAAGGLAAEGDAVLFVPFTGPSSPGVSPDGRFFAFHSPRSGSVEIWLVDENGKDARQLTHLNALGMGYPKWSRDGKRIAFHASVNGNSGSQIYTLDVDKALSGAEDAVRRITNGDFGFLSACFSSDGKFIYANRAKGGTRIFRIPADGGTPEDLFEGAVCNVTSDGHRIVYGKIGRVGIFWRSLDGDVATNSEEKLVDDYRPPGADLNPVQDGLYYIGWNGPGKPRAVRFYNYALRESVDVAILPPRVPDSPGLAVTPDRRRLVFSQFSGTGKDLTLIDFR